MQTYDVPTDADADGMPDNWELTMNLNPADPTDGNSDINGDGYSNLENYLNSLLDTRLPAVDKHPSHE